MRRMRREFLILFLTTAASLWGFHFAKAFEANRPAHFLAEELRIIEDYYQTGKKHKQKHKHKHKGLPPGLAKRGGSLPPGLQKQLDKNGRLPPGLQKRLAPLPQELESKLPQLPDYWERVILERDIVLIDRRTERILDIVENVVGLIQDR